MLLIRQTGERPLVLTRIINALRIPFDTSSEAGRAKERHRRIALAVAVGMAGRVLAASLSILTVSLTIGYLGGDRYGLWLTLSSVVTMLSFADFGIGNGLMTKVAEADGKQDALELRRLISSAFFVLSAVACVLSLATIFVIPLFNWAAILGVTDAHTATEVKPALVVLAVNSYVAMPFSVVQRVQSGLQAGYASALWSITGTALALLGLVAASSFKAGLVALVFAISVVPTIVTCVNFCWFFCRQMPALAPTASSFDTNRARTLLKTGMYFALLQLASSLAFISDNYVVARELGTGAVPSLAVPAKLFALLTLPVTLTVAPLWPAYGEAHARGDNAWIRDTLRRSITASVAFAACGGGVLLLVGPWLVRLWTRDAITAEWTVLAPLAVWTILAVWGQATAAFLNGVGRVRAQALAGLVMAVSAYGLKWWLIEPLGPGGVVWATVIAYFMFAFIPISVIIRKSLRSIA